MKKIMKILAVALAALLFVPAIALAEDTVKIGIFEPITGATANGGAMELQGYDIARELFPTILDMPVEFVVADSQSDKVVASNAAAKLVSEGVVAVLGSYGSGLSMAGDPVFSEAGVPALTATSTNPMVTQGEWYARISFIDPFQGTMLARYAVENGYKKVAIFQDIEADYAVGLVTYFNNEIKNYPDVTVTSTGNFVSADQDFSALLTEALRNEPDVIFTSVQNGTSAGLIIKQARDLGYTGPIIGGDTLDDSKMYELAGQAASGVVFSTFCDADQPANDLLRTFLDAYHAKYGEDSKPAAPTIMCFDAYLTMKNAIETAGTIEDKAAIRDALFATSGFEGAAGVVTLDENHNAIRPVVFMQVQDDLAPKFVNMIEP
jgi:branched-chain amino acid transport system substrate-binding protein